MQLSVVEHVADHTEDAKGQAHPQTPDPLGTVVTKRNAREFPIQGKYHSIENKRFTPRANQGLGRGGVGKTLDKRGNCDPRGAVYKSVTHLDFVRKVPVAA